MFWPIIAFISIVIIGAVIWIADSISYYFANKICNKKIRNSWTQAQLLHANLMFNRVRTQNIIIKPLLPKPRHKL